jgi:hypothetical protein
MQYYEYVQNKHYYEIITNKRNMHSITGNQAPPSLQQLTRADFEFRVLNAKQFKQNYC